LNESGTENSVILVADADMLADGAAVDIQTIFGQRVVVPSNGNLAQWSSSGRSAAAPELSVTVTAERGQQQPARSRRRKQLQQSSEKISRCRATQSPVARQQAELESFRKRVVEAGS
jgi:hypothetical protein